MNHRIHQALSVAAALLAFTVAACTNLTLEPKSTATDANVFSDPGTYKAFIARVYAGLAVSGQQGPAGNADIQGIDEGFSQYLRLFWEHEELPTDEAIIGWGDIGLPEMNTQQWAVSNGFVGAMYYRIYFQIGMANEFLRQTTDAKLNARGNVGSALRADIKQYRAEARFLRALSYWHGIDMFGDNPLITDADLIGVVPQPSTRTNVYNFIVSELNAIIPDLPPPGLGTYGRASAPAAQMLLAHAYLNAGVYTGTPHYAEALTAAQAVIAWPYSLDASYRHLFLADNNTSPEIIFPVIQDGVHTQTWGGVTFLVHASCGGSMRDTTYGISGCWWGLRLKPEAFNRYASGDQRAASFFRGTAPDTQSVAIPQVGTFTDGIAAPKFQNKTLGGASGSNPTHVDTDFPMFRLGDAYLIYAEAFLRGGGGSQQQALDYVNALRVRAYGDSSAVITAPQLTLDFILDERGRELLWEGHRRTDLVRFGKFTGGSYLWAWKGGVQAGAATDSHLDLYPIPSNELIANPKLKQNPGY